MINTNDYKPDHTLFGGEIDVEDFNTSRPNKKRNNNHTDINSKSYREQKELERKYKSMTLEELREMRIISNTNGRPTSTLTDEKWQKEFSVRKMFITPHNKSYKKLTGQYYKESGMWNEELQGTYHGCTNWQSYCTYINSVLDSIRAGQSDFCYFIYQIMELAKFHPTTLRTKYLPEYECWEVWLER